MDFTDKAKVDKLLEHLLLIAEKLMCKFCDRNLVDPTGLKCVHKFCSKCIRDHVNMNETQCPTCKEPVLTDKIKRTQTNIRLYQNNLKKLLKLLEKKIKSSAGSARLSALKDFFETRKTFTQLKCQFEASDDQNANEEELKENRFIKHNTSIVMSDSHNIVDETMNKSFVTLTPSAGRSSMSMLSVDETVYGVDEKESEPMSKKSSNKRKVLHEKMDYGDMNMPKRDSDSNSSESSDDDLMDDEDLTDLDSSDSDDALLKDTQSQVPPVKKQCITYAHKLEDHFDRVVKKTEKSVNANKSIASKRRSSTPEMQDILDILNSDYSDSSDFGSY